MSECPWCGAGIQTIIDDVPHYDCGSLGGEDAWQSRMCMRAERVSLKARNAELLAACRMARQYPAAITTELALDAAIAKTESEGE